MDGASNTWGSRIEIVLGSPEGVEHSLKLGFSASNNEIEYEALVAKLWVVVKVGVANVEISSESCLVVSQVKGDFEARDPRIANYLKLVRSLQAQFGSAKVT